MSRSIFVVAVLAALPMQAFAVVSPFIPAGPTSTGDVNIYFEAPPGSLTLDGAQTLNNVPGLTGIMAGDKNAPGGNVELFASSEVPGYTLPAFQAAPIASLSGTSGGHAVTLRSLNGLDWFGAAPNYSYGQANLANKWFNDFLAAYNYDGFLTAHGFTPVQIAGSKPGLYAQVINTNGIQRISDPNLGYANWDSVPDRLLVGLEGSDNYITTLLSAYLTNIGQAALIPDLPSPIQASEVVAVSVDGGPTQYWYGFNANSSGLSTQDGTASYTVNFEVPEPASLGLLAIGAMALMRRKR